MSEKRREEMNIAMRAATIVARQLSGENHSTKAIAGALLLLAGVFRLFLRWPREERV